MNIFVSWCYDETAKAESEEREIPTLEWDAMLRTLGETPASSKIEFDRELVAVQITVPELRKSYKLRAASRITADAPSVAEAAFHAFEEIIGPGLYLPPDSRIRIIGFEGLGDFLRCLAAHCSVLRKPLPYAFWAENSRLKELPVSGSGSARQILQGYLALAEGDDGAWLADLYRRWGAVGASALTDMRVLLTVAGRLGMISSGEYDTGAPDDQ